MKIEGRTPRDALLTARRSDDDSDGLSTADHGDAGLPERDDRAANRPKRYRRCSIEQASHELGRGTILGLAGKAAGAWLFSAVGLSPAAVLASVTFTWTALRAGLNPSEPWITSMKTTMKKYLLPLMVLIAAAGLAGCAGQSQYSVQFFKVFGSGDLYDARSPARFQDVRVITVFQGEPILPRPR